VRTGRARSKIRHYLKTLENEETQALGQKMLAQALRAEGCPCRRRKRRRAPVDLAVLLRWSGNRTPADLLTDVGTGKKIATIVAKRIAQLLREQGQVPDAVTLSLGRYSHDDNAPARAWW
jgi:GTP pyrophosphokinase/guanosine-3',5'-bis(diphosphate) 3'-pyrophosphohydrolase